MDEASLPGSVLVDADTHTYTIYDGYPKAQFHFLIMPRLPFAVDEDLGNGKRRRGEVGARELDSIGSLLQSPHAAFVLDRLAAASERLAHRIRESMRRMDVDRDTREPHYTDAAPGATWGIRCGFHAIPSMRHLHMHVRWRMTAR